MLPNFESNKKKNPLDIFNGTSAAMGSSPFPVPKNNANKPSSINPTPSPMPAAAAPRQTSGDILASNVKKTWAPIAAQAQANFLAPSSTFEQDLSRLPKNFNNDGTRINPNGALIAPRNSSYGNGSSPVSANPTQPISPVAQNVASVAAPVVAPGTQNAQRPAIAAPTVEPGSVAASVSAAGNPMYDNSSIAQLNARNGNVVNPVEQPFTRAALNQPAQLNGRQLANNVVSDQRGVANQVKKDSAAFLNPMSNGGEILRRMDIAASTMRGSPSSRNKVLDTLSGQLDASNKASSAYQDGANEAFARGQTGDIQAGLAQQQTKGQAIVQDLQQAGNDRLERIKNESQGTPQTGADGNSYFVRGTSANAVTNADGSPFKTAQSSGMSTDKQADVLLKQLSDLDVMTDPEGKQRAEIQARLKQIMPGGEQQAAAPNLDAFIAAAKSQNSKMTDEQLKAAFASKYGK